jgi:hypothetical protein
VSRIIEREALAWMGTAWRLIDMVKPVRTIDEMTLVVTELLARPQGPPPADSVVRGQLEAARLAEKAVGDADGDERTLEAMRQRVQVLEELRIPATATTDPLAGSLNKLARPDAMPIPDDPSAQPIGAQSVRGVVAETFRAAASGLAGAADSTADLREAHARLIGRREALRGVAESLDAQAAATGEEADTGDATAKARAAVEIRLEAVDAAAAAIAASARPPVRQRPQITPPSRPATGGRASSASPSRRRRIGIVTKPVEDEE